MALKSIFQILAEPMLVKAGEEILMGQWLTLTAVNGVTRVKKANATDAIIGLAGDTKSASTASDPYTASIVVSPDGVLRQTQNRVSDQYDETTASGKMTVYHNGGTFASDQIDAQIDWSAVTPMTALYVNASGNLTTVNGGGTNVATFVSYGPLESGVPGTDVNGSMSLGNYVVFVMKV